MNFTEKLNLLKYAVAAVEGSASATPELADLRRRKKRRTITADSPVIAPPPVTGMSSGFQMPALPMLQTTGGGTSMSPLLARGPVAQTTTARSTPSSSPAVSNPVTKQTPGAAKVVSQKPSSGAAALQDFTGSYATGDMYIKAPHGRAEMNKVFGEPGKFKTSPVNVPEAYQKLMGKSFKANYQVARQMQAALDEGAKAGVPLKNWYGMINVRNKRPLPELPLRPGSESGHSWGAAFDFSYPGGPKFDPRWHDIVQRHGFKPLKGDYGHYQYFTGY